jgi:hypothetical protein
VPWESDGEAARRWAWRRRKDKLEDEGEKTWQEVIGGNEEKGKGMGQDGAKWKTYGERWMVEEIGEVTMWGPLKVANFGPPPPILKVE